MRSSLVPAIFLLLVLAGLTEAQYRAVSPVGDPEEYLRSRSTLGLTSFRGLLDPSRLQMSHLVSVGYATSGGQGVAQGLYLNRIGYQLSRPLFLTADLGYLYQHSGFEQRMPSGQGSDFVGGASLSWRPLSNALFRVSYYHGLCPDSYGDWGRRAFDRRPSFDRP